MYTSKIEYLGELRTEATHLQSGKQIITDAPTDNHGKGEAFVLQISGNRISFLYDQYYGNQITRHRKRHKRCYFRSNKSHVFRTAKNWRNSRKEPCAPDK